MSKEEQKPEAYWIHCFDIEDIRACTELGDVTQYFRFSSEPTEEDIKRIAKELDDLEADIICNLATKNLMLVAMIAEKSGIEKETAGEHLFYSNLIKEYVVNVLGETLEEAPGANDYISAVHRMVTKYL